MTRPTSNPEKQGTPDGLVVRGRPPFAMTPTSLLRNPSISSHAVRLWSVLASYTYGDQATDRPSRSQLASDVGWKSIRSVDTYLAELQRAGYLTVEHQWRTDRGQSRSLYILEWEPRDPTIACASGRLWMTPFPQVTPMRRILHGGSRPGRSDGGQPRFRRSDPGAGFCTGGHRRRNPCRMLRGPPCRILHTLE